MTYDLMIGDRSYSSWSLRGWLGFVKFGLPLRVEQVRMNTPAFAAALLPFAPARTVPAVRLPEGRIVYDTLAIAETLAERHPDNGHWPRDPAARALARSYGAEMHAGFQALRDACPMNLRRAYSGFVPSDAVRADLARIETLWLRARAGQDGWLFGDYCMADAFFAPVAARIATYGLAVGPDARSYVARHLADLDFRRWRAMGFAEGPGQDHYDRDLPPQDWPGPTPLSAEPLAEGAARNATCPFSGRPVAADSLARIGSAVLGFCNPFCRDKAVADPEAWPEVMAALQGVASGASKREAPFTAF